MAATSVVVALWCLLGCFILGTAGASPIGRKLKNDPNSPPYSNANLPACPVTLSVTDTGVAGMQAQVVLNTKPGTAIRTFTCSGDRPELYSEFATEFTEETVNWVGNLTYDANGFPTYELMWQDGTQDWKQYFFTVQTFKEFVEVPSPKPNTVSWARYKVQSDTATGLAPFSYIERADTAGGAPPSTCGGHSSVQVPYTASYKFYACHAAAVVPPPPPPLPSPLTPPAVMPSPIVPIVSPSLSPSQSPAASPPPAPASPQPVPVSPMPVSPPAAIAPAANGASPAGSFTAIVLAAGLVAALL